MEAAVSEESLRSKIWSYIPKIKEKGRQEEARSEWKEEWNIICRHKYSVAELEQLVVVYVRARMAWDVRQAEAAAKRREKLAQ